MNIEFCVILSGFLFFIFMFHLQQGEKNLSVNAVKTEASLLFVQYIVGVLQVQGNDNLE